SVVTGAALAQAAPPTPIEVKASREATNEAQERDVDEVALGAQEKAISRIQDLLRKYRGTSQEPVLLAKLADVQQQSGAILFRIAHGQAARKGKGIDLRRYQKTMKQSIESLNTLIAKYPRYEEVAHA